MVRGIEVFREKFREYEGAFVLIGGAACDEWFASAGLEFRATKDLDIVLIIEVLGPRIVRAMREFIADGEYQIRQRTEGSPVLYRFSKPNNERFPFMIELFSRKPDGLRLEDGQEIVPISGDSDHHSLSAILLDDDYYSLIQNHQDLRDGLFVANATSLIPLKARAWVDLTRRKADGEDIDSRDIAKHRNDVFRLAATLADEPGPELPVSITNDLSHFLAEFPENSPEWLSILASLKGTFGGRIRAVLLRSAIQKFFQLPAV